MHSLFKGLLVCLIIVLAPCIADDSDASKSNNHADGNSEVTDHELERQLQVFESASNSPGEFRERLKKDCPHFNSILLTTAETNQLGTRVFNAGGAGLTVRIYEVLRIKFYTS